MFDCFPVLSYTSF